jgi:hypothetical protein
LSAGEIGHRGTWISGSDDPERGLSGAPHAWCLRWLTALGVLAALVAGFLVWSPGLNGPYQFDDYATPLDDPASQSLSAWRQYLPLTLRPLTKLSYALEADAGLGGRPGVRRAFSIGLLAAAALLLYLLIFQLQPGIAPLAAAFLAALWFLHPVHADGVLMLSGRTALLAAVLLLAALLAFERARPLLAGALFLLACLARETALAGLLPLAVLAAGRPAATPRAVLRALAPVLAAGLIAAGWFLTTPRYVALAEYSFLGRPLWDSLLAQVGAVPVGLAVLLQPSRLSIDYGIALPAAASEPLFLAGLGLYLIAAAGMVLCLRRSRSVALGLALWLAALLPTQSLVPKLDALSNRPLGLALAGLLIAAAPLLGFAAARVRTRATGYRSSAWLSAGAGVVALVLLVMLAGATAQRSALFRSELALWEDAAAKSSASARPHVQYATLLKSAGRDPEAWQQIVIARGLDPFSARIAILHKAWRPERDTP